MGQPATEVVDGHYEAGMVATVLRRCPSCETPHPRTRGKNTDFCECGSDCGEPVEFLAEDTAITGGGVQLWFAAKLLKVAKGLNRLAKKL